MPELDKEKPPEEKEVVSQDQWCYVAVPLGRSRDTHLMVVPYSHLPAEEIHPLMGILYGAAFDAAKAAGFESFEVYISVGAHSGVTIPEHAHLQVVRYDAGRNSAGMGTGLMKDVVDFLPTQQIDHARNVCRARLRT